MSPHALSILVGAALLGSPASAAPDTGDAAPIGVRHNPFNLAPHRTWRLQGLVAGVSKGLEVPEGAQVDLLITFDPTVTSTQHRSPAALAFHAPATLAVHVQIGDWWLQSQPQTGTVEVVGQQTQDGWTDWALPPLPLDVVRGAPADGATVQIDLPALLDDPGLDGLPAEPMAASDQTARATLQVRDGSTLHTLTVVLHTLGSDDDGDGLYVQHEAEWGSDPWLADSDGDGFDDGLEAEAWTDPIDAASMPAVRYASSSVILPDHR